MSKFLKKTFKFKIKPIHFIEYCIFLILVVIVRVLPLRYVHKAGFLLVRIFYPILGSRRKVALRNLHNAFPEWDKSKREEVAFKSFQNIAVTFVELLWQKRFSEEGIKKRVSIDNFELFKKLQAKNKGIIFLTAHFGSWEFATQALKIYSKTPTYAVAKQQKNYLIDRAITKWREMFGVQVISHGIVIRKLIQALHKGSIITLIADQAAPKESVSVKFFGREVPTYEGPAVFALKTGAPLVFGCTVRQADGNYIMHLTEIPTDDLHGVTKANILELTKRHIKITENIIRQYPEQWMWMHKRWKHVKDRAEIKM